MIYRMIINCISQLETSNNTGCFSIELASKITQLCASVRELLVCTEASNVSQKDCQRRGFLLNCYSSSLGSLVTLLSWSTWCMVGDRAAVVSHSVTGHKWFLILAFAVDIVVVISSTCSTSASIASSSSNASNIFPSNGAMSSSLC